MGRKAGSKAGIQKDEVRYDSHSDSRHSRTKSDTKSPASPTLPSTDILAKAAQYLQLNQRFKMV